jgi:predicted amidohydrolase YtcJ
MDTLFYNGNIITLHNSDPKPEAVLVRDDKILATGFFHLLKNQATNPEIIDLKQNILLPAFTDAHTHFIETANHRLTINLIDCKSDDDLYQRLKDYRKNVYNEQVLDIATNCSSALFTSHKSQATSHWLKGFGWEKRIFDKYPTINKTLLDKVFPDVPVSLASRDLHANLCNSKVLELIGANKPGFTAEGIEIGRFSNGEPNGYLYENSWSLLAKYIPKLDLSLLTKLVKEQISDCHKMGLCGVHSLETVAAARLAEEVSRDSSFYFTWYYLEDENLKFKKESNLEGHFVKDSSHFRNAGIKTFSDGSLGSDTAWLFEKDTHIDPEYLQNLYDIIENSHRQGVQIAVHAIGDFAVYHIASMMKAVNNKFPHKIKHRIEHLQAVRPEDIQLLKEANIHASMQSVHIKEDASLINKKWLKAKEYSFPIKSIMSSVEMALGSDTPVETLNPFEGIKYAVKRDNFLPKEAISIEEAIKAYTYKHHIIANKKITYGLIKTGQIANLMVIDKNLLTNIASFNNYTVEMMMVDGKIVYRK